MVRRPVAASDREWRLATRSRFAIGPELLPKLLPKLLPDGLKSGRSGQHRPARRSRKRQVTGTFQHRRPSIGAPRIGVQVPPRPRVLAGQWAAVRPGEVCAVRAGVRRPVDRHGGREAVYGPMLRVGVGGRGVGPLRRALQSGLARPAVAAAGGARAAHRHLLCRWRGVCGLLRTLFDGHASDDHVPPEPWSGT